MGKQIRLLKQYMEHLCYFYEGVEPLSSKELVELWEIKHDMLLTECELHGIGYSVLDLIARGIAKHYSK